MDSPPIVAPHCANEFNVGVLDGVGVGLAWLQALRWVLLVSFQDDINLLFCLPNPTVSFTPFDILLFVVTQMISTGSFIYTTVKAVHCGDPMIGVLLIFVGIYEIYFKGFKRFLIMFHGRIDISFWIFALSCSLSISYGGQMRIFGIVGLSIVFLCECYHAIYYNFSRKGYQLFPGDYIYRGPAILCQALIYPIILACFITIIVRDYSQWIPRPQSNLEYFFLIVRVAFGSGLIDVLKIPAKKIYRFFKPESESDEDEDDDSCMSFFTMFDFWNYIRHINVTWIGVKSPFFANQMRVLHAQQDRSQ